MFVLCSSAFAVQLSTGTDNLQIKYPVVEEYLLGETITLYFHVYNSTGTALTNTTTPCYAHVYNQTGQHIRQSLAQVPFQPTSYDYELVIDKSNITTIGKYSYIFQCQNNQNGGFVSDTFFVRTSLLEDSTNASALIFGIIGVIFCLIYLSMKLEKTHFLLQLLLLFFVFILFQSGGALVAKIALGTSYELLGTTFYKITTWLMYSFLIYTFIYVAYEALLFFGIIKKEAENV